MARRVWPYPSLKGHKPKVRKLARNKNYDPTGKAHLLHAGVNKEKEYILNWMRKEYSQNEPYNMSDGIWIVLAKHIEEVEKTRMTAQEKFFALVEKWG